MVIKRSIPNWSAVLVIILALAAVAAVLMRINPSTDKDAILKLRTKPGGAGAAAAGTSGMPRGTPINHALPGPTAGSRQKPMQG